MADDYYAVLGLPRTATEADIKKAYRKLALQWHPDKNPDNVDEAKQRFQLISEAYDVLSNPQKRREYDTYGKAGAAKVDANFTHFRNANDIFREMFADDPAFASFFSNAFGGSAFGSFGGFGADPFGLDPFAASRPMLRAYNFVHFSPMFAFAPHLPHFHPHPRPVLFHQPFFSPYVHPPLYPSYGHAHPYQPPMHASSAPLPYVPPHPPPPTDPPPPSYAQATNSDDDQQFTRPMSSGFFSQSSTSSTRPGGAGFASSSMFSSGPGMTFASSSSSSGPAKGVRSRSVQTTVINGVRTTVTREVDADGNETVTTETPQGRQTITNGRPAQSLLNRSPPAPSRSRLERGPVQAPATSPPPPLAQNTVRTPQRTQSPIVIADSPSSTQSPASPRNRPTKRLASVIDLTSPPSTPPPTKQRRTSQP